MRTPQAQQAWHQAVVRAWLAVLLLWLAPYLPPPAGPGEKFALNVQGE